MQTKLQLLTLRPGEGPAKEVISRPAEKVAARVVVIQPVAVVGKVAAILLAAVADKVVAIRADVSQAEIPRPEAVAEVRLEALHEASLRATGRPRSSADEAEFMHLHSTDPGSPQAVTNNSPSFARPRSAV